jgi:hypothetical protein
VRLSETLAKALVGIDVVAEPRRVAQGATLLEQVQKLEQEQRRLSVLVDAFVGGGGTSSSASEGYKSLADRAFEVLRDNPGPMPYREIAAEIRGRGFQHAHQPKSPNQLSDSVWSAMYEDSQKRFVKVGRGIWDLRERHPDRAVPADG